MSKAFDPNDKLNDAPAESSRPIIPPGRPRRRGLFLLCPHRLVETVWQIAPEELRQEGITGVILDLDNTLVEWNREEMTAEVEAWLSALKAADILLCILSNSPLGNRSERIAARLNCSYVRNARKPSRRGFYRAMAVMNTTPATTAIVGDQMFTDILGGNRAGIYTVMVKPIHKREFVSTQIVNRPPEKLLLRYFKRQGKL